MSSEQVAFGKSAIDGGCRFRDNVLIVHGRGDANDAVRSAETRLFCVGTGEEFKHGVRPVDVVSDRTLPWPHALRERLADDGDGLVIFVIEVVEVASLKYGNAKRREKARRDSAPHRAGVFVGVRVTVSGVLKTGTEILSVAPGRHETEGCARDKIG